MESVYLIIFTLVGGVLALFAHAGWSSYTTQKLPDYVTLFRTFAGGLMTAGLGAYAWIFGFNGDPTKLFEHVSKTLEVKETLEALSQAAGGAAAAVPVADSTVSAENDSEIKVGMPNF